MPSDFIFAGAVQKLINQGERKIILSKQAKISPAALDLIRDHEIKVIYKEDRGPESPEATSGETIDTASEAAAEKTIEEADEEVSENEAKTDEAGEKPADSGLDYKARIEDISPDLTEAQVEEITRRVVERLNALKKCTAHEEKSGDEDTAGDNLVICRCEEVTRKDIKEVIRNGMATLNGIKRVTRAGMGLCQGQTCQALVTRILAQEIGVPPAQLEPTTARAPVRPIRLSTFAGLN